MSLTLRKAVISDLDLLRAWDEQPHVIASDPNDDWHWETELLKTPAWREQLIALWNGVSVGFIEIIDPALEEEHYWGDCGPNLRAIDIWIGEPDYLNRGIGTQMMTDAIERCFSDGQVVAIINDPLVSNTAAIRFYRRLGFEFVENRRFGQDDCAVHRLTRVRWQQRQRQSGD